MTARGEALADVGMCILKRFEWLEASADFDGLAPCALIKREGCVGPGSGVDAGRCTSDAHYNWEIEILLRIDDTWFEVGDGIENEKEK